MPRFASLAAALPTPPPFLTPLSLVARSLGQGNWGPDVDALFNKYANDLAQQGATSVAAKYIRGNGEEAAALRERIASKERSLEAVRAAARAKEQQEQQAKAYKKQQEQQAVAQQQQQQYNNNQYSQQQPQQPVPAQLPPGWLAMQDPTSGRTYYANQQTGQTTWDPPPGAPAPTPVPIQIQVRDCEGRSVRAEEALEGTIFAALRSVASERPMSRYYH